MGKTTKYWPIILFLLVWLGFGYKFFFKGLVPMPLDFLTNFYGPWQAYQGLPIKNPAIPDVVSQIIPWKILTIESLKKGIIPFWNPYNFSGSPLMANFQSAVFHPLNFLFFIFNFVTAWSFLVLLQPLLAGIFTFYYGRQLKLGKIAALLAALSWSFSGFMTTWLAYGTLGWAIVWLPAALLFLEKYWQKNNSGYLLLTALAGSLSLLSGHLQISLYLFFTLFIYILIAFWDKKITADKTAKSIFFLIFPFLFTGFQLLPTYQYYQLSTRGLKIPIAWFTSFQMPFQYLITFIFPDFFGNPVTRNLWGQGSYVEMSGYIGLIPFLLAVFYLVTQKLGKTKFFIILSLISLLLILKNPFSSLPLFLKIPVLSSSSPARIICLLSFSLAILAGFGWESFWVALKEKRKLVLRFILVVAGILLLFSLAARLTNQVAFKNTLLALIYFFIFSAVVLLFLFKKIKKSALAWGIIILIIVFDLFRFWHKFTPFTEKENFYPQIELINFLQQNSGLYRELGTLPDNLNIPFGIYSPIGYDSLSLPNYQQLLLASREGENNLPARTVGEKIDYQGNNAKKIIDLIGIKYLIVGKSDLYAFPTWKFPESFQNIWEDKNFIVFENKQVWPRYFFAENPEKISAVDFLGSTLDLLDQQSIVIQIGNDFYKARKNENIPIIIQDYTINKIKLKLTGPDSGLLFLSDVFYPDWQVYVNGQPNKILKAAYAFRAVELKAGENEVIFEYKPRFFQIGLWISLFSFILAIILVIFDKLILKKK